MIDFLKKTFDAIELRRYGCPTAPSCMPRFASTTCSQSGNAGEAPPASDDVDATYKRALEAGGISVQEPPRKEGDADRRAGIKDPRGNTWWIATPGWMSGVRCIANLIVDRRSIFRRYPC